jgi:hypothetical protein
MRIFPPERPTAAGIRRHFMKNWARLLSSMKRSTFSAVTIHL